MIAANEHLPLRTPSPSMSKRNENRRDNLRRLQDEYGGPKTLAEKLGYANSSFLVQMTGPNPTREVTEKTARKIEEKLGLEENSLDWPARDKRSASRHTVHEPSATYARPHGDTAPTVEIIRALGSIMERDRISVSPTKLADIVAFALQSNMSRDEETLRNLLSLMAK